MLRNYLLVALRNLRKHRLYSSITIGGLAVGLAACLMLVLFVRDELTYDTWLPNADRIAKLEITFRPPGREPMAMGSTPGPAKAALEKDYSTDIEHAVRMWRNGAPVRSADKQFNETISYVDPAFFSVFDIPMAEGQREQALANNTSILVSERIATKYFGDAAALGQVLTIDNSMDFVIVGVFADMPRNTHLELDFIALFDTARYVDVPSVAETWTSANVHTYVLFRTPEASARVEGALGEFADRNIKLDIPGFDKARVSDLIQLELMPLLDIHLYARKPGYVKAGGDITSVITFSAVAVLILLIACINFVNLATARSMSRAREVAMRKVVGATRTQLVGQFLGEALITALIALLIATALVEVALGSFNEFLDKELSLDLVGDPSLILMMLGLVAVVGLIGGLYPAVYLARFRPATVLKANQSSGHGSTWLRNTLVVFQFAVSIGLIVSTALVFGQARYARNLDLGFQTSNKVALDALRDMPGDGETVATLKREIAALPQVRSVSLASDAPPLENNNNTVLYPTAVPGDDSFLVETMRVDHDFFSLYGVAPLAGRVFTKDIATDARNLPEDESQEATQSIVVNEMFVTKLALGSNEQAIGHTMWDTTGPEGGTRVIRTTIVGVVPNMHLRSINFELTPMLYTLHPEESGRFNFLAIDVEPGQMSSSLLAIGAIWTSLAPNVPISTQFIDQKVAAQYDAIEKRGNLFGVFALFAVLIACLGLFGLASFAAERRTKEIGVRKALGASVLDIVRLLMWQFSKPVLIANAIAWPAAYYVMNRWLGSFRYHIEIADPLLLVPVFGGAGILAMAIAWATVAGQAARVARASPIHALRCE